MNLSKIKKEYTWNGLYERAIKCANVNRRVNGSTSEAPRT